MTDARYPTSRLSRTRALPKKDRVHIFRPYPAVSSNFVDIILQKPKLARHLKDLHPEHHLTPDPKIETTQPDEKILNPKTRYTTDKKDTHDPNSNSTFSV